MQIKLNLKSNGLPFFNAPQAGRKVTAGFSYLQHIGRHATTNVWTEETIKRFADNDVEWAAIRQFEFLKEADNLAFDDIELTNMKKAHECLMYLRGDGYRMTTILLGRYDDLHHDELAIADQKIQKEIALLINFLYLDELSEHETQKAKDMLKRQTWDYQTALPHIAKALGERELFQPEKFNKKEKLFFKILQHLNKKHILHETAVGLVLPNHKKVKNWIYIPESENSFCSFHSAINTVLRDVTQDMPAAKHIRGYGHHMHSSIRPFNKQALRILNAA